MDGVWRRKAALGAVVLALQGCVLAPRGTREEKERLAEAARAYEASPDKRALPRLQEPLEWLDLLHHAFLANGELEAAFREWQAALDRVTVAAGYPNTNTQLSFQYMFSGGRMKGWDRTTLGLGFDPMVNLSFPAKTMAAGRVALDEARVAADRFHALKFDLQQRVLVSYYTYALVAERVRLQQELLEWNALAADSAQAGVVGGEGQPAAAMARVEAEASRNELASLEAELAQERTTLNALLGREPGAVLPVPAQLPDPRQVSAADAEILAAVARDNPDSRVLADVVRSRVDALAAARLRFLPDFNPFLGMTGSVSQMAGAAIILPTTLPQIRASIDESRHMLQSSEALLRQTRGERSAQAVGHLLAVRDSERQIEFLRERLMPALELAVSGSRAAYVSGSGPIQPWLEGGRTRIALRRQLAELRMARERHLAELETIAGTDLEALEGRNS